MHFMHCAFNTLAQNGTSYFEKPAITVSGKGSELSNIKALKAKSRRKVITQKMILSLVDVSEKYGTKERTKSYWNTYHCQNKLYTVNGRVYGKFCKNRFCTLCCSIRKAEIINKFLPVIVTWKEPYFVTLTIKAVPADRLRLLLRKTLQGFQIIKDKYRKRNLRGKDIKLIGIKSLECNFNAKAKTYNPHLHLIVANKMIADILKKEWLILWKGNWSYKGAQKIRPVEDTIRDLIEIVKYGSKIFTEPDVYKKVKGKGERKIYVAALDNIFAGMKGLRIFDRFGFNLPTKGKVKNTATRVKKYNEWVFDPKCFDWLNINNGKSLTDYKPVLELIELLNNNIDTVLQ
jgi:hypothetical protein